MPDVAGNAAVRPPNHDLNPSPGTLVCERPFNFIFQQENQMTTLNLQEHRYDKFSVIGFSVPERLIPVIDELASREFIARSAWLRKTVLAALAKSDRQAA